MSEVPKKSRLRRRPTTDDEAHEAPAPVGAPEVAGPVLEAQPSEGAPAATESLSRRESPRANVSARESPRTNAPLRESPRADGITVPAANSTPREIPEPHQPIDFYELPYEEDHATVHIPTEQDNLVANTGDDANANAEPQQKKKGFHFRRGRKGPEDGAQQQSEAPKVGFTAEDRGVRPMPRYGQYSMFDFLLQSNLLCGMGYNVNKFHRHGRFEDANPGLRLDADADGLGVGINVLTLNSYGEQLIGIVKPLVKIHAVSIDTGYYIKSRNFPAVIPVTTKPCALLDATTNPTWNQELILNAYFSDVVGEDTLLLFEILDDKPSLRTNYSSDSGQAAPPIAKRVAWGYLLPIGMSGEMNVGFSEDWKFSSRRALDKRHKKKPRDTEDGAAEGDAAPGDGERDDHSTSGSKVSQHSSGAALSGLASSSGSGKYKSPGSNEEEDVTGASAGAGTESPAVTKKSKYPWDKPSVDKHLRIQLHYYRQYDGVFGLIQRKIKGWPTLAAYTDNGESSYPDGVPEVYVQWRLQSRQPIDGAYLSVRLGPRPAETMPILLNTPGGESLASPLSERGGHGDDSQAFSQHHAGPYTGRRGKFWAGMHGAPKSTAELGRLRTALLKRTRGNREPCVIPDKLLYRVDVGNEGALVVSFSHSGHILAVAAKSVGNAVPLSTDGVLYSIILYDTDLKEEVWVEDAAHHGPIYELKWSRDDRFLLSCSGDGTCKVWDMLPVAFRSSNTMGFGALNNATVGRVNGSLDASVVTPAAHGSSRPPSLVHTLVASPPVYTYSGVFQDQAKSAVSISQSQDARNVGTLVPRIITGGADGKLRVWDNAEMVGYVVVAGKDKEERVDYSPHEGQINSIVIDERSRYMISGDSFGDIFAWRCDAKGWYQLLRKFKRDSSNPTPSLGAPDYSTGGGILSLSMHPDKHKGQMIALSRQPARLKVINMSTYKTQCVCSGYAGYTHAASTAGGIFNRAQYSADGRYAIAGSSVKAEEGLYRLQVWDTNTGHTVRTPLSDMMFPYPIRSVSWHPAQHLLAVSMVGHGAAVVLYAGDRESADKTIDRMNVNGEADARYTTGTFTDEVGELGNVRDSIDRKSLNGPLGGTLGATLGGTAASRVQFSAVSSSQEMPSNLNANMNMNRPKVSDSLASMTVPKPDEASKLLQSDRAKEMLEKIRAAKAAKQST